MNKFNTVKMIGWTIVLVPTILFLLGLWFGLTRDTAPTRESKTKSFEIKTTPKEEPKPEVKVEPKPEVKVEPKSEPKVEPKVEPKIEKDTVKVELAVKSLDSLNIQQDTIQ